MKKLSIEELNRIGVEEYKRVRKIAVSVVMDNVRSIYNVGSLFRTSDAFRVEKIYLCGITSTPENSYQEIHKTALGAEDSVEWEYIDNISELVRELKKNGYAIVSVEQVENSIKLDKLKNIDRDRKYALIFGNEVKGVQQAIVDMSDFSIEIPQYGTKHSLNVSVSAGIVLWEFVKLLM